MIYCYQVELTSCLESRSVFYKLSQDEIVNCSEDCIQPWDVEILKDPQCDPQCDQHDQCLRKIAMKCPNPDCLLEGENCLQCRGKNSIPCDLKMSSTLINDFEFCLLNRSPLPDDIVNILQGRLLYQYVLILCCHY